MTSNLIAAGFSIGLEELAGLEFDPKCPYRACFICGAICQTSLDRQPTSLSDILTAKEHRDDWARRHRKVHTTAQHRNFQLSGGKMTPEAANKLAAFGIIDVIQLAVDEETGAAYREAPRQPHNDAEGG